MFAYLKGFFLKVEKLHVCFNPDMSFEARHGTIWDVHNPEPIGIRLNHPEVLVSARPRHLREIRRQAELCGYDVTHLTTDTATYPLENTHRSSVDATHNVTVNWSKS